MGYDNAYGFMNRSGARVKVLKCLYYKNASYGSKITRDTGISVNTGAGILSELQGLGYTKVIKRNKHDCRRIYYELTKKGRDIMTLFIGMEKQVYGVVL